MVSHVVLKSLSAFTAPTLSLCGKEKKLKVGERSMPGAKKGFLISDSKGFIARVLRRQLTERKLPRG